MSIKGKKSKPGELPHKLYYRGLADDSWELVPSLGREDIENSMKDTLVSLEGLLIETAVSRYPDVFGSYDSPLQLLAKLQHYNISTRLLDITSNPLVALYFACSQKNDENNPKEYKDGEIIAFSSISHTRYDPYVSIIADSYDLIRGNSLSLNTLIDRVKTKPYVTRLLHYNVSINIDELKKCIEKPIFVDPGFISQRQTNQQGSFILFPYEIYKHEVIPHLVRMDKNDSRIVKRIQIPKNDKKSVLKDLARLGITKEFIYPDAIDDNCADLVKTLRTGYDTGV